MQCAGQVVGAADPKSGRPETKSRSAGFVLGSPWFNPSAAIVNAMYIFFFLLLCTSFEIYIQTSKLFFRLISFI